MVDTFFFTCEHGGHRVPSELRALFRGRRALLESHRGFDAGALELARFLARRMGGRLFGATTTRLVVDLNRSPHNPRVYSIVTRTLPRATRVALLERHHEPHWTQVASFVREHAAGPRPIVHVAVHSFTPVWEGRVRRCDVGILYDPRRGREKSLARLLKTGLEKRNAKLRVRFNDPYLGYSDGLPTALRRSFGMRRYLGIELEVNQRVLLDSARKKRIQIEIQESLEDALSS